LRPRTRKSRSTRLHEIASTLGLDYSPFELKEKSVIDRLATLRNSVAHGRGQPISQTDYNLLHTETIGLLDKYKDLAVILHGFYLAITFVSQPKFDHDKRLGCLHATRDRIQLPCRGIRWFGGHPCLTAAERTAALKQSLEQPATDALAPVCGGDPDLIDPEFRRLVRMDIMHRRRHSDDQVVVKGHSEVMPGVSEKLRSPAGIDGIIKDARSHPVEYRCIARAENANSRDHRPDLP
jgi:hypothetical protein